VVGCVGGGVADPLAGLVPPVPAFWLTCAARVADAVSLEVGVGVGDGLELELGELGELLAGGVLASDGDRQLGVDVPDEVGPVPPGTPLYPVGTPLTVPEVE
jgi:hypothetical protein